MFNNGALDLKVAYIEEKKMYKAQLITRYMVYEQEILKKAWFSLKRYAHIDEKRALKKRDA